MNWCMLSLLSKLALFRDLFGRRRSRFPLFRRNQPVVTPKRGGMAVGTLAAIALPFIVRKLRARRAPYGPAY